MENPGSGKGGLKSPKSPRFTLVTKDGRRVQVSRRDIEQMIIRHKARRGSGSLIGLGEEPRPMTSLKSPLKSPSPPKSSPRAKTPPRIRESWNADRKMYKLAHPMTGRLAQIKINKIEKARAQGLAVGSPALARKLLTMKYDRLAAAKLLPPKTPRIPKEPKNPRIPKEPKAPKITEGWLKNRSKYTLTTNNGRRSVINAKKINAQRLRTGNSSPKIARNIVARRARHAKGEFSPKVVKERVKKAPRVQEEGWTGGNKPRYMVPTNNGFIGIGAKKMNAQRRRTSILYSSPKIARNLLARRARHAKGEFSPKVVKERPQKEPLANKYDSETNKYFVVDESTGKYRIVAGKKVRDAMNLGEGSNALAIAKKILVDRTKNPGVSRKQDRFSTKIGGVSKSFSLSRLEYLQSKYGIPTLNAAAQKYVNMDAQKPPKGVSGYAPNVRNTFNTKYYYWTGKKHKKIAPSEMQKYKNAGMSDEDAARRAMDKREPGWTKDGSAYIVNMSDSSDGNVDRKLRRIEKATMERIQSRLSSFGLPSNDTDAGLAWIKSKLRQKTAKGRPSSYFDYASNEMVSNGMRVPGPAFVPAYIKASANNKDGGELLSGGIVNTVQRDVVGDITKNNIVKSIVTDEPVRARIDKELLKRVPPQASSKAFSEFLIKILSFDGPLESRPLIAGNVGYFEKDDQRNPIQQLEVALQSEGKVDGCKLLKSAWPRGQGYGLQLHQGVIYALANLRALDKIKTPGLAAIHSVGAGKTIEGLATLVAFWNKTFTEKREVKPWGIFPMSVRSNQSGNDIKTLAADAVKFFRYFKSTYPGTTNANTYPFAGSIKSARLAIEERIIAGYRALGYTKPIDRSRHLLGSFGTTAHNFYGDLDSRGRWTAPGFPFIGKDERLLRKVQYAVFIVDEIQLLNGGSKSEASLLAKEYPQIRKLLSQHRDPETTWVLGMTATPGESLDDVAHVMEYIAGSKGGFGTEKLMRKNVRGLVSYAFTMADTTKFPLIKILHECIDLNPPDENEKGPFAERYASTLLKYHETKNINMLTSEWGAGNGGAVRVASEPTAAYMEYNTSQKHKFWLRVRRASEYIMVGAAGEEANQDSNNNDNNGSGASKNTAKGTANGVNSKTMNTLMGQSKQSKMPIVREIQGYYAPSQYRGTTRGVSEPAKKQREFFYIMSPKLVQIATSIMDPTNIGVHYVYSPDSKTLRLIAWLLKTRFGYEQYKAGARGDKARFAYVDTMSKPSPYWYAPGTDGKPHEQFGVSAVDVKGLLDKRTGILRLKGNERGEKVRVVLATRESYKGIDIKGVTHIHLTSTLPDYTDLIQLIGRGTRMCGHDGLRMSQRKVTVHIYKLVSGVTERTLQNSSKVLDDGCLAGIDRKLLPDCYVMDQAVARFQQGWGKIENILMEESIDFPLFKNTYNKAVRALHDQIITKKRPCQVLVKPDLAKLIKKVTTPKKPRKVNEVAKLAKQMAKLGL